jgi:DHA1 family multidrug/chloramphenicol efflux transport protein-like MFS transporter
LYQLATYMANDMYVPALPNMAAYFGCSRAAIEWTVIAFCAGSIAWVLWLGLWAQRWGRRACLLASGLVFVCSSALCTLAGSIGQLIVYRFFQGSVICCVLVAGYATIQELYSDKEALSLLGKMTAVSTLGPALGPLVGVVLLQWGTWKWCFYAVLGLGAIGLVGLYYTMPDERRSASGAPLLSWQGCCRDYLHLAQAPAFTYGAFLYGGLLGAIVSWIMISPSMLQTDLGVSLGHFGFMQLATIGGFALASWSLGRIIERFSPLGVIHTGVCLAVISASLMALAALFFPPGPGLILAGTTLVNIGAGLSMPAINRVLLMTHSQLPMVLKTALSQFVYIVCMVSLCGLLSAVYCKPSSFCFFLCGLSLLLAYIERCWRKHLRHSQAAPAPMAATTSTPTRL